MSNGPRTHRLRFVDDNDVRHVAELDTYVTGADAFNPWEGDAEPIELRLDDEPVSMIEHRALMNRVARDGACV